MNYTWANSYLEDGPQVFDETAVESLNRVSNKYRKDFVNVFAFLAESTKSAPLARSLVAGAKDALFISDTLNLLTEERMPKSELEELSAAFIRITSLMRLVKEKSAKDKGIQKALKTMREGSNIDINDLSGTHTVAMGIVAKIEADKQSKWEKFEKAAPLAADLTRTAGKMALFALLGPMAPLAMGAMALGTDIFKGVRGAIRGRAQSLAFKEMDKFSAFPEARHEYSRRSQRGSGLESVFRRDPRTGSRDRRELSERSSYSRKPDIRDMFGERTPSGRRDSASMTYSTPARSEAKFAGDKAVTVSGLFEFYNEKAYKAKWTSEVLDVLKKIAKQKKVEIRRDKGSNLIEKTWLASKLMPFLRLGTRILGVVGVAIAAFAAGTWLYNKFPKIFRDPFSGEKVGDGKGLLTQAFTQHDKLVDKTGIDFSKLSLGFGGVSAGASSKAVSAMWEKMQRSREPIVETNKSNKALKDSINNLSQSIEKFKVEEVKKVQVPTELTRRDVRHSGDTLVEAFNSYPVGSEE